MFKLTLAIALVAAVNCGEYESIAPQSAGRQVDEHNSHPQYSFAYSVHDSVSGDSKNQVETRNGDEVQGEYSLVDADGFKRTVRYTANDANGFNAVVDRQPIKIQASIPVVAKGPVVAKVPVIVNAPEAVHHSVQNAVPVSYSAPAIVKSAPVTYIVSSPVGPAPAHVTYTSGQVVYRSLPLAYNLIGGSPIAYSAGPFAYSQVGQQGFPVLAVRGGW